MIEEGQKKSQPIIL